VQWVTGAIVTLIGIAATARLIPALADYTYPLVWWGALLLIDAWNERRVGRSLWRGSARHFLLITVPTSVLYWLLFELLNLASPQWRYRGNIESVAGQSLFGFVSFATVIPIMVEAYWLVMGTICPPGAIALKVREWKAASIITGLLLLAVPLWNRVVWFNQGMWVAPALVLLPFTAVQSCDAKRRFLLGVVLAGLLAGFSWELINNWAPTHWEYLILPRAPHLFEMPVAGYLGFIPFGLATAMVYQWQLRLRP